jgi:uncharacterized protein YecT (DUF1311 family)
MELQMTKDEALKLALEALEARHFLIHGDETKGGLAFCMDGYYSGCFDIDSNDKQTNKAITAIKEALAQPEQEAVGKFAKFTDGIWREVTDGSAGVLLYTTPQRTWVGLTKDEVELLSYKAEGNTWKAVELAEAKLKEKNT